MIGRISCCIHGECVMTRTNRPKAQHYVPQFYLRNFATKNRKHYSIRCFDKSTGKAFTSNVKNVSQQNYFYDFKLENGEEASIEELLSRVETNSKPALSRLLEKPTRECLEQNKYVLTNFVYIQEMRSLVFRENYIEMITSLNSRFKQKLNIDSPILEVPTQNDAKEFQAMFLIEETEEVTRILGKMKWVLFHNETNKPFWTSDNPIFHHNINISNSHGNYGLLCPGVQLFFPLSPALALIICDPLAYGKIPNEIFADEEDVEFQNRGQIVSSKQYLFASEGDFSLAKMLLEKRPKLSDPNRLRYRFR